MSKFSVNLPTSLVENIDYLADEMETDRTDVITEILEAIMENEDLIDMIFGEVLQETDQTDNEDENETETANANESDEEVEDEDENETEE